MTTRALPVGLLLLTLVLDGQGAHRLSFYVLVAALAAAAVAALGAFGDLVELPGRAPGQALARLEVSCGALGAVLVLVAAAARGQTATAETVPALAVSATVGALLLLGPVLAAVALGSLRRRYAHAWRPAAGRRPAASPVAPSRQSVRALHAPVPAPVFARPDATAQNGSAVAASRASSMSG